VSLLSSGAQVPGPRPAFDEAPAVSEYAGYKVLLDDPADVPGLGFDGYAAALAEAIVHSRAEFSVGIFGSWGSGKTTLMRAIERIVAADDNVVPVWFAAWRYEKDPDLLLPLLDGVHDALAARDTGKTSWARSAATGVSRAGQAFLAGVRLSADLRVIRADFDVGTMTDRFRKFRQRPTPLSYQHKGFQMLRQAIDGLSANGTRRLVIFVDDLDRCLPGNALDVLESMKHFFDVEGCVFVVGLDLEIAERAVALKYSGPADAGGPAGAAGISGSEYLKKLFQVWFSLPPIKAERLPEYLATITHNGDFGAAQQRDFANNVQPHLNVLQQEGFVNPREIKRLINLYTLQLKMLSPQLGAGLNPNIVLALLCMSFRPEWQSLYEQLTADPSYFRRVLREALTTAEWPTAMWLAGIRHPLPTEFVEYVRGLAAPLLGAEDLGVYVSLAEATKSTDPWVLAARTVVSHLRGTWDELEQNGVASAAAADGIASDVGQLNTLIGARQESFGRLGLLREQLQADSTTLMETTSRLAAAEREQPGSFGAGWRESGLSLVDEIDAALLSWHRYIS
jgi:KAP family P-loop domain